MKNLRIDIPDAACEIMSVLMEAGYEAYIVGGCVRDSLYGRQPKDWDITTSAKPEEVKALFNRTIDTGIMHGTVTVMINKEGYEVTTYRIDGEYTDHRHPTEVIFTNQLVEDLKRRDFTINAMAYNPVTGLVDVFDGVGDLEKGIIRCVGCARERFNEDALRMLRAVRFAAQLGFDIEEETQTAIREQAADLKQISAERIQMELVKILISPHPGHMQLACDLGITKVVLPEYDRMRGVSQKTPHHIYDVEKHTIKAMESIEPTPVLRLAMLFHDIGKPDVKITGEDGRDHFPSHAMVGAKYAQSILKRLKFDNHTKDRVIRLVKWHAAKYAADEKMIRHLIFDMGEDIFSDFISVQKADVLAKREDHIRQDIQVLEEKERLYHKILQEKQCISLKQLKITGRDLMQIGIEQGPCMGIVMNQLIRKVLDDQSLNDYEQLCSMALYIYKNECM